MSQKTCVSGKVCHEHKKSAKKALVAGAKKGWRALSIYKCELCGCYHVGRSHTRVYKSLTRAEYHQNAVYGGKSGSKLL